MVDPRRLSIGEVVGMLQERLSVRGLGRKKRKDIREVVSHLEGQVGGQGEGDLGFRNLPISLEGEYVHQVPQEMKPRLP